MTPEPERPAWLEWVAAQGEMGARVAAFDWPSTPLGPITTWPAELRAAVTTCVGSPFPTAVCLGAELRLVYNDACREIYGPDRFRSALGRPNAEVWPETADQTGAVLRGVFETGRPFHVTDGMLCLDRRVVGEESYFTFSYTAIIDGDGVPRGVLSTFVETTGQVLADRRLRTIARLERKFAGLRRESALADVAMDVLSGNAVDHSAGALYRAAADATGGAEVLASFGEPIDGGVGADLVRECSATGSVRHSGGLYAFPVLDPERDVPTHVLVVALNPARPWDAGLESYLRLVAASFAAAFLTLAEVWAERRRAVRAETLDAAKSAFFAGVSHELRTPLSLISAPVEDLLERGSDLDPAIRRELLLVQSNVARLTRLVDAMLDFSRMEAGRVVPHLQPADVSVLVAGLAAAFAPAMERAGLAFTAQVPPVGRRAMVDRDFLERIVLNLLSNAAKFTPEGSVQLRLSETASGYEIAVTDTGLGIDAEDQDRVFDRFERLTPPAGARSAAGAGIGLAMVRQLTLLLGGSVHLASEPGRGSTFSVRLPFEPALPAGVAGRSITPRRAESFLAEFDTWAPVTAPTATDADAPSLLVVEDDAQLVSFLVDSLRTDYRVAVAGDGAAALAVIRERQPDLVLTDLALPGLDGLGLVSAIRSDPALRHLPVLLLTAKANEDAAAAGLAEGADDYIAKPFAMTDLRARLRANLERARERVMDASWRRAVLATISDGVMIFDSDGLVLELNQSFTDLFGFSLADGPIRPPYPWWPTEAEDAELHARIVAVHTGARRGHAATHEFCYRRRDRRPVWVRSIDAPIREEAKGVSATLRILRDITRERAARERRAAAAQISADFGTAEDLDTLLAVAEHGFEILFDGGSTVQLTLGRRQLLLSGGTVVTAESLPAQVQTGLTGEPSPDTTSLRPGILLVPRSSGANCRAWVQFPQPRRIGADEMIVADLLAQAFALAVDRVVAAQQAADREANLEQAVESHRLIGQAIGILVERHRLVPAEAFDRLKSASQNRNLKLRELARRVIESGQEPEDA